MKRVFSAMCIASLGFVSCSVDDDSVPVDQPVEVPATYNFERGGNSTVNFGGQTTRLIMAKDIVSSFTKFETATEASLLNKFANTNSPFSSEELNTSSKSVKSKVAASSLYFAANTVESNEIKADFESYIKEQVNQVFPNKEVPATAGVPGQLADGTSIRYVNEKGLELDQAFAKGLIGALVTDQMLNNYLSLTVLDEGDNIANNNAGLVETGKDYTTMEHKWDEAYGYLYGDPTVPTANPNSVLGSNADNFLFKYVGRVENDPDFAGIAQTLFEAFKTGRAAIVAGNYEVRNEQIAIIRENVSKIIGIRSVYYLQAGKRALADGNKGKAFHALSEGFGFIYSLRFTHNPATNAPYVGKAEIEIYLDQLMAGNGFWDVTPQTLDNISQNIADAFDFTLAEAAE